ncbi:MAG: CapA family protein [Gammaproteobacteria bacterium]|nr:MAG: CapA family protein [Gammaproteobacteria bacterium]
MASQTSSCTSGKCIKLFLCGDVMTGRGIDQILPHPSRPHLYESYMKSAEGYVEIAENANGEIDKPVSFDYIWGDALAELERAAPDLRLINLETAVTISEDNWPGKGINYRMHPANIPAINSAMIDGCILANNHVLDWGYSGLIETLETLDNAGIKTAGAGHNQQEAGAGIVFELPGKGRVLLFAYGHGSSGVPWNWRATHEQPGVNLLDNLSGKAVNRIARQVSAVKKSGDIVVASIHWGSNWGYGIPRSHQHFAHRLIDEAGVDILHGHSSHHPRGIEVYKNRPILYGCGDFLNDYEGIRGHERYRNDLTLMYLVTLDAADGRLIELKMVPFQIRKFRLRHPSESDRSWLSRTMNRECAVFGANVTTSMDNHLELSWDKNLIE